MALALIKPQHRHQQRRKGGQMRRRWVMGDGWASDGGGERV